MLTIRLFCAAGMSTSLLVRKMIEAAEVKAQMQAKAKAAGVPCDVIPMADYGMVNGKNVLAFAKKLIG